MTAGSPRSQHRIFTPNLPFIYSIQPSEMLQLLYNAIEQTQLDAHEKISDKLHNQEKISYAIIVSLFAVSRLILLTKYDIDWNRHSQSTESKCREIRGLQLPPFRPHTLACLLDLIKIVMYPGDTIIPNLDLAQNILLRWGGTVPWCWSVWDDQRVADAAFIVSLVCHQINHSWSNID